MSAIQITEPVGKFDRDEIHLLYSEDLNHGQDYEGVKVINPFL